MVQRHGSDVDTTMKMAEELALRLSPKQRRYETFHARPEEQPHCLRRFFLCKSKRYHGWVVYQVEGLVSQIRFDQNVLLHPLIAATVDSEKCRGIDAQLPP